MEALIDGYIVDLKNPDAYVDSWEELPAYIYSQLLQEIPYNVASAFTLRYVHGRKLKDIAERLRIGHVYAGKLSNDGVKHLAEYCYKHKFKFTDVFEVDYYVRNLVENDFNRMAMQWTS